MSADAGHVFVVHGDLTRFACDAWLLPTDAHLYVTDPWWTEHLTPHLRAAFCRNDRYHRGPILPDAIGPERCRPVFVGDPPEPMPRPWLTVMGAGRVTLDWYLDGVRRFIAAALAELAYRPPFLARRVRRLLAVPLVGTGHGGAHRSAGLMAGALVGLLCEEAARHRVDLALVTNKRGDFAAAQAARRHLGDALWSALTPAAVDRARALAREAGAGQLVVFLGAGVGAGAGLPLWDELLTALAERAGLDRHGPEWPFFQALDALDKAEYLGARLRGAPEPAGVEPATRSAEATARPVRAPEATSGETDAIVGANVLTSPTEGRTAGMRGATRDAWDAIPDDPIEVDGLDAMASVAASDAAMSGGSIRRATTAALGPALITPLGAASPVTATPPPATTPPRSGVGAAVVALLARHRHYGLAHALVAGLPTREAITTNYDRLYELACEATGRPCAILPYAPRIEHPRWLLKMHGCVDHPDDIILTRENYLRYAERNAALAGIVQAMLITRSMLFLGFSLGDDNFLRIVDAVRRAIRPAGDRAAHLGTALMLTDNPLLRTLWGTDLDWLCFGAPGEEPEAARRVEIFLDCLGLHATDTAYLLDARYQPLRTDAEDALVALLTPLRTLPADHPARAAPAWALVETLLHRLGGW